MRRVATGVAVILLTVTPTRGADRFVRGRVVDDAGRAVPSARVDRFWSGNGTGKDPDGAPIDLSTDAGQKAFWGHLGEMEPRSAGAATTGPDGAFSLTIPDFHHAIMAMDPTRRQGGIAILPKGTDGEPVTIHLRPLVRVRGAFEGPRAGDRPHWTNVYILLPDDPERPLDSYRLAHCGSFEARFEVALPPGEYVLEAYGQSAAEDDLDVGVRPNPRLVVRGDTPELDLGTLRMAEGPPSLKKQIERAKANGSWGDYTKHYGEPPPRWHITDARGVAGDAQIADFRGKWVLVEFWGLSCRPCLAKGLPRLMRFYEDHASQRDKFEILAVCIDHEGELRSLAEVDRALQPIVEHVWGGKTLPFPVLLDPTFITWERYGLPGLGTVLLVDPEGKLVPGDETTLAEVLAR